MSPWFGRSECVPKNLGSSPMLAIHWEIRRAVLSRRYRSVPTATSGEEELARLLIGGFDVTVDRLTGMLRHLKPDGLAGLLLAHGRSINSMPVRSNVLPLKLTTSHPRSLLSMARLNMARSRVRSAICSLVRIGQTCFGRRGGFTPINLPLFQGSRLAAGRIASVRSLLCCRGLSGCAGRLLSPSGECQHADQPAVACISRPIGPSQTDPRSRLPAGSTAWKGPGIESARLFVGKQELIP
jgi:hypothetical protein